MAVKKGDFVELNFTAIAKIDNSVFDTTLEDVAKKNGIFSERTEYKPVVVCVGENQVIKGLDDALVGKDIGKFSVEIDYKNAFGAKNPKLITMISMSAFKKENIKPYPGMAVNIDGAYGVVKTASSGRVVVDFNHPLSGKDVVYDVEILRIIDDDVEKIKSFVDIELNFPKKDIDVALDGGKAKVILNKDVAFKDVKVVSDDAEKHIKERIKELLNIDVEFEEKVKDNSKDKNDD